MALRSLLFAALVLTVPLGLVGQTFDYEAYREYLRGASGLTAEGLQSRHPAGLFSASARTVWNSALHSDSIQKYYGLTDYERSLVEGHGFMVTERNQWPSFGLAYREIFVRDLPVFVSTDAILHAVHMSYDKILSDLEQWSLRPELDTALRLAHRRLEPIAARYRANAEMSVPLVEADLYITVARSLLAGTPVPPLLVSSTSRRDALLSMIAAEQAARVELFSSQPRDVDFSQFRPRGHYTRSETLQQYFRTMMWLGRVELYLDPPRSVTPPVPESDVQLQTIISAVLHEAFAESGAIDNVRSIDRVIGMFVGEQDNVTLDNIGELMREHGLADASALLDRNAWIGFRDLLRQKPYARQRILSQILMADPFDDEAIEPASSLMVLGQRFILDSYILGNVVFDKVEKPRMLPSSLDVLFALGNDGAAQLLQDELDRYGYAKNLAGMRYVVDTYDVTYWSSTIYGGWLGSILALAPPGDRSGLPPFMRTAAWWQEKMNTQLASWAELRHDNLLYAKQSYSGGNGCSFPHTLIEPATEFYVALGRMARRSAEILDAVGMEFARDYFREVATTVDTLESISRAEIDGRTPSEAEILFMQQMLYDTGGCEPTPGGWYARLYYGQVMNDVFGKNLVVADVHTAPTDADGNRVGWVMHVGTGMLDMAVVLHTQPGGGSVAYIGPVMSYHERITDNFRRLTDEEWSGGELAAAGTARPAFVNLYLAGPDGGPRGEVISLKTEVTGVQPAPGSGVGAAVTATVSPNPSTAFVDFDIAIPPSLSGSRVVLTIADVASRTVSTPLDEPLRQGRYLLRWPTDASVPAGVYLYSLSCGGKVAEGKIVLAR